MAIFFILFPHFESCWTSQWGTLPSLLSVLSASHIPLLWVTAQAEITVLAVLLGGILNWSLVLCILTSFWVLHAPKSWLKIFFSHFSTYFVHFKAFSVISRLKSTNNVWKWTRFCLLLKAGRHAKAGRHPEGVPQNCLFSVDYFQTFFVDFSREITEKVLKLTKKVEKRLKKMFRPAFGWAQHPKAGWNTQHPNMERLFMLQNNLYSFTLCSHDLVTWSKI